MQKLSCKICKLIIVILFVICHLSFVICSLAQAKEYDGLWFLGFNLKQDVPAKKEIREAVAKSISIEFMVTKIISDEVVPGSIVPPGMDGYDKQILPPEKDLKLAAALIKKSGIPQKKLKNLVLLHTDGVKTIQIADLIKKDLWEVGIDIKLEKIAYAEQEKWAEALSSGKYDFFLMGYKSDPDKGTLDFLLNLFSSSGEANFTFYNNKMVDSLLSQISKLKDKALITKKLKEINQIICQDQPVVGIFYITKL